MTGATTHPDVGFAGVAQQMISLYGEHVLPKLRTTT